MDLLEPNPLSAEPYRAHTEMRRQGRLRKTVDRLPLDTPADPKKLRFVCISDTHNQLGNILERIPNGDVLLHCGDFTNAGSCQEVAAFSAALDLLPHKHKIVIAGNHEFGFDEHQKDDGPSKRDLKEMMQYGVSNKKQLLRNCIYLQDSNVIVEGYKIHGSPWHPMEGYPFYQSRGGPLLEKWRRIPLDTDVLMTHTPPLGHGDYSHPKFEKDNGLCGCTDLLTVVADVVRPCAHVFGHIHPRNGVTTDERGNTLYVNAAICYSYDWPRYPPIIFDLPQRPLAGDQ